MRWRQLDLFLIACSVYLPTFFLSLSWAYRLSFLLLALPQLLAWSRSTARGRLLARAAVLLLLAVLWTSALHNHLFTLAGAVLNGALAVALLALVLELLMADYTPLRPPAFSPLP